MKNELPIKIGHCYETLDSLTIHNPSKPELGFLYISKGCIVLVLEVHNAYERKKSDIPYPYMYGIKILFDNKIGWFMFHAGSHSHKMILEDDLLQNIEI